MDAHHHGVAPGLATSELAHRDVVGLSLLGTAAARALVTPISEKAPDAANVGGPVQTETQYFIFEQPTDEGKCFATVAAHLALAGFQLHATVSGSYIVTRWNLARELRDVAAVQAFAQQVGVRA